jgi:hypothetical protein
MEPSRGRGGGGGGGGRKAAGPRSKMSGPGSVPRHDERFVAVNLPAMPDKVRQHFRANSPVLPTCVVCAPRMCVCVRARVPYLFMRAQLPSCAELRADLAVARVWCAAFERTCITTLALFAGAARLRDQERKGDHRGGNGEETGGLLLQRGAEADGRLRPQDRHGLPGQGRPRRLAGKRVKAAPWPPWQGLSLPTTSLVTTFFRCEQSAAPCAAYGLPHPCGLARASCASRASW